MVLQWYFLALLLVLNGPGARPDVIGRCVTYEHLHFHRLAGLWDEEIRTRGEGASLRRVVWHFCRTRLLLSILCLMVTQLAGFSGPVSNTI